MERKERLKHFHRLQGDSHGWWFLPSERPRQDFFDEYEEKRESDMSEKLHKARLALVENYLWETDTLLDVGIGSGKFVEMRKDTDGADVDPKAIDWLRWRCRLDDGVKEYDGITFWDSFEHIEKHAPYLERARKYVFISLPIFSYLAEIMRSKHFKPDEHLWYFSIHGLTSYMSRHGFNPIHYSRVESILGRDEISTFVFVRKTRDPRQA